MSEESIVEGEFVESPTLAEEIKAESEAVAEEMKTEPEKTEAQKLAEENTLRLRAKVKEQLWPLLLEKSKSVDEAKMMCESLNLGIQQAHANLLTSMKVSEFHIENFISKEIPEEHEKFSKLLEIVQDETCNDARRMLGDLPKFIDGCIREEMIGRKLSDLKAELL